MERVRLCEGTTLDDPLEQSATFRTLHDDEQLAGRLADFDRVDHSWMAQLGEDSTFGAHAIDDDVDVGLDGTGAPECELVHHLDGEPRRRWCVAATAACAWTLPCGLINGCPTSTAELCADFVLFLEGFIGA